MSVVSELNTLASDGGANRAASGDRDFLKAHGLGEEGRAYMTNRYQLILMVKDRF